MEVNNNLDEIQRYLEDNSNLPGGRASGAGFPANSGEIADFLRAASRDKIPVTISGGGTGVTGGRIPFGGLILSLEKMNRVLKVLEFPAGGRAIAEAGVLLEDFQKAALTAGLFYPPDPTETTAFVGGTVAVNASGARTYKYGPTRNYVESLKIILSDGDELQLRRGEILADDQNKLNLKTVGGRRLVIPLPTYRMPETKHQAGYFYRPGMDAVDLFVGSEGTLGVIYEVELKLLPELKGLVSFLIFFTSEEAALKFVDAARKKSRSGSFLDPLALEYLDRDSLDILRVKYPEIPPEVYAVLYEQEAAPPESDKFLEKFLDFLESQNALTDKTWTFINAAEFEYLREFRHSLPELINEKIRQMGILKIGTDLAVPDAGFFEMADFYRKLISRLGVAAVIFGHIGNSHFHVNFFPNNDEQVRKVKEAYLDSVRKAVALGGTVSAEHGIGKTKHAYLLELYGEKGLREMAAVKKILDPALILNRGNIIPEELLR